MQFPVCLDTTRWRWILKVLAKKLKMTRNSNASTHNMPRSEQVFKTIAAGDGMHSSEPTLNYLGTQTFQVISTSCAALLLQVP